jgi:cytochrome c553
MRRVSVIGLALACFVAGAGIQRWYDARRQTSTQVAAPLAASRASAVAAAPPPVPYASIHFEQEPLWAYGFERPPQPGEKAAPQAPPSPALRPEERTAEQTRLHHIPGSRAAFSLLQISDGQDVVDWFPEDHPPMPDVVAHGPAALGPLRRGCALCHLPNGKGRPENAPPGGLARSYIRRQLEDFRSGLRYSADARKPNTNTMIDLAKAMTDEELQSAADYFASVPFTPWVRVIETDRVPKTRIDNNLFLALEAQRTEPIAGRIIEVPENEEQSETYRNPHSGFIAYVPPGSIAKGKELVTTGGTHVVGQQLVLGKTTACITCHGAYLTGIDDVPAIAGRSPSYIVRQLWDIQQGTRRGVSSALMKAVVANLNAQDFVEIAAYIASVSPVPVTPPAPIATSGASN